MKPLILNIRNEENIVIMKVKQQDEFVRGKGLLTEFQGIKLISGIRPHLDKGSVFICGTNKEGDYDVPDLEFDTKYQAEEYIRKVESLVTVFNTMNSGTETVHHGIPHKKHNDKTDNLIIVCGNEDKKKYFNEFANKHLEAEVQSQFKPQFEKFLANIDELKGSIVTAVEPLELSHSTEITIYLEKDNVENKIVLYLNNDKKLG